MGPEAGAVDAPVHEVVEHERAERRRAVGQLVEPVRREVGEGFVGRREHGPGAGWNANAKRLRMVAAYVRFAMLHLFTRPVRNCPLELCGGGNWMEAGLCAIASLRGQIASKNWFSHGSDETR